MSATFNIPVRVTYHDSILVQAESYDAAVEAVKEGRYSSEDFEHDIDPEIEVMA